MSSRLIGEVEPAWGGPMRMLCHLYGLPVTQPRESYKVDRSREMFDLSRMANSLRWDVSSKGHDRRIAPATAPRFRSRAKTEAVEENAAEPQPKRLLVPPNR
jgi:hypothetical protein